MSVGEVRSVTVVEGAWRMMRFVLHELGKQVETVPAYLAVGAWHWDYDLENTEL